MCKKLKLSFSVFPDRERIFIYLTKKNMRIKLYNASTFRYHGLQMINRFQPVSVAGSLSIELERFRTNFGTSPFVCHRLWNLLNPIDDDVGPCHLLWTLFFIKLYLPLRSCASIAKIDEKTFTKWVWDFLQRISDLKDQIVSKIIMRFFVSLYLFILSIF